MTLSKLERKHFVGDLEINICKVVIDILLFGMKKNPECLLFDSDVRLQFII